MIILISPAKKLDLKPRSDLKNLTQPKFIEDSNELAKILKGFSENDFKSHMGVSSNIAKLNTERMKEFSLKDSKTENHYPVIFTFSGEVYQGLKAEGLSDRDINYANENLRILSGLYGILKPLDLIQPYRLEMGTSLENKKGKNLYEFWQEKLTKEVNDLVKKSDSKSLINLASNEYFNVLKEKELDSEIITPIFKDFKNGEYKTIMVYAKKMRGVMAKYIIQNQINNWQNLKRFKEDGYIFDEKHSNLDCNNKKLLFIRG